MALAGAVDAVLEAPIAPSFSRIGYSARRRADGWTDLDDYDLTGRRILVTGATSGLGKAAASQLASNGAGLVLLGRNRERTERAGAEIRAATGSDLIEIEVADMGELDQVEAVSRRLADRPDPLHAVVHNAGALSAKRRVNRAGIEATVASQVLGPFLMTGLLVDKLRRSAPARVVTMSSGGMYGAALTVDGLQMGDDYQGATQYALAKRAQVTLNEIWAERVAGSGIRFHAVHPGWADTPGVREALPRFRRIVGPFLRTPEQGADTLVWLLADDEPLQLNGRFWHDRRVRTIHRLGRTRRTDTPERRERLWRWCVAQTGLDPSP